MTDHAHQFSDKSRKPRCTISCSFEIHRSPPLRVNLDKYLILKAIDQNLPTQYNYPCRVSLTDSREGDELLLINYEHHDVHSPYRMRFAIYVRKGEETYHAIDRVP